MNRREFLTGAGALATMGVVPRTFAAKPEDIRAVMLGMGRNMWGDWRSPEESKEKDGRLYANDKVVFDETVWRQVTGRMAERGLNLVLIDLGEFMEFPSHPELAVRGSWKTDRMRTELQRLRELGLEPIPKLNFSATHDQWLGIYHRMISTPQYYQVVRDVIRDVVEVFGRPRFFHLGWDEERIEYAGNLGFFSMRTGELWWHDFLYTVKCVEDCGCRPWVWSDYGWHHVQEYLSRCPKSVIQSNWYYDEELGQYSLDPKINEHAYRLVQFLDLEKAGFDQVPCGTTWAEVGRRKRENRGGDDIIGGLVSYCRKHISATHLKGFMMAAWTKGILPETCEKNIRAVDLLAEALKS